MSKLDIYSTVLKKLVDKQIISPKQRQDYLNSAVYNSYIDMSVIYENLKNGNL